MDKAEKSRKELYFIIDHMPEEGLETAKRLLEELIASLNTHHQGKKMTDEEFNVYLDNAPLEDEEISEEELRGIEEGRRAIREGRAVSFEEAAEELGI